jgi:S1-C subfamily serine protease
MAGNKTPKEESYSISSKQNRPGKTVSFTVPAIPKPSMSLSWTDRTRAMLAAVALVLLTVFSGFMGAWFQSHSSTGIFSSSVSKEKQIVTSQGQLINQIAKSVGPSVVSVNVSITGASQPTIYDYFGYGQQGGQTSQAAGTGIILTKSGIIMTNRHVVPEGTTKVSVTLSDGTELKDVSVIGRTGANDSLDIAFLKVGNTKGHSLTPAVIGDSSKIQIGDNVVAIGNALGEFQNTVTSGIISGYGRSVQAGDSSGNSDATETLSDLIQTDAAINEGNSGGPLANLNGQVIGINTAIAGNAQNIGFAIPVNEVKGMIEQVIKTGKFARPYLGVRYVPLTADVAATFEIDQTQGAYVPPTTDPTNPSVLPDSPAAAAGIQERDVIVAVDGTKIDKTHSLTGLLSEHQPGDKVKLTVIRDGKTITLTAAIGTLPTATSQPAQQ